MSIHAQLVELKHSRNHKEPKYIALEDLNFAWLEEEILLVIRMKKPGVAGRGCRSEPGR